MNHFRLTRTQGRSVSIFLCMLFCLLAPLARSFAAPLLQSTVESDQPLFTDDFSESTFTNRNWKDYDNYAHVVNGVYAIDYRERRQLTRVMGPYVQDALLDMKGPIAISFDLRPSEYNTDDHLLIALNSRDDLRYYIALKIYFDGRYELGRGRQRFIRGQAEANLLRKNLRSHVQVEVNRYVYRMTINGKEVFSYPRLSPFVGKIGLGWSKQGGDPLSFSIDNVQFEILPQEQNLDELAIPLLLPGDTPESAAGDAPDILFQETFDDNHQRWLISDDINVVSEIADSRYVAYIAFSNIVHQGDYVTHLVTFADLANAPQLDKPYELSFDLQGKLVNEVQGCLDIAFDIQRKEKKYKTIRYCPWNNYGALLEGEKFIAEARPGMPNNPFSGENATRFTLIVDQGSYTLLSEDQSLMSFDSIGPIGGSFGIGTTRVTPDNETAVHFELDNIIVKAITGVAAPHEINWGPDLLTEHFVTGSNDRIQFSYPSEWSLLGSDWEAWYTGPNKGAYELNIINDRRITWEDSRPKLTPGVANQIGIAIHEPTYVIETALIADPIGATLEEMAAAFVTNQYGAKVWSNFAHNDNTDLGQDAVLFINDRIGDEIDWMWLALRNADKTTTLVDIQTSDGQGRAFLPAVLAIAKTIEITAPDRQLDPPEEAIRSYFNIVAQGKLQTAVWMSCADVIAINTILNIFLSTLGDADVVLPLHLNADLNADDSVTIDDRFRYYETVKDDTASGSARVRVSGIVNLITEDGEIITRAHSTFFSAGFQEQSYFIQRAAEPVFAYFEQPLVAVRKGSLGWQQCSL